MAVTISKPTLLSGNLWQLSYSSDLGGTPTFYIRRDGQRMIETTATETRVFVAQTEQPVFWISDVSFGNDEDFLSGVAQIQVFIDETTTPAYKYLKFEESVSAVWTLRKQVEVNGSGYYTFTTRFLEDETTHSFRVTPVGENENSGTAASMTIFMVRNPDAADVTWTYDGSTPKTVTIAAV